MGWWMVERVGGWVGDFMVHYPSIFLSPLSVLPFYLTTYAHQDVLPADAAVVVVVVEADCSGFCWRLHNMQ